MKFLETNAAVDRKGHLRIPEEVLIQLELSPGDEIRVLICDDPDTLQDLWREFVSRHGGEDERGPADNEALEEIVLPGEMLAQAGFRAGDGLDAVCGDRKIVITASDEAPDRPDPLDNLPEDLRRLCNDLGFNPDTVQNVMQKGGYFLEYEAALTRFEARFNSPRISDVTRGLIGVLRGDDGAVYFQMLDHDFKALELQRLRGEALKIPPKIRVYSFVMLMCFLFTWLAVMAISIMKSLGTMF